MHQQFRLAMVTVQMKKISSFRQADGFGEEGPVEAGGEDQKRLVSTQAPKGVGRASYCRPLIKETHVVGARACSTWWRRKPQGSHKEPPGKGLGRLASTLLRVFCTRLASFNLLMKRKIFVSANSVEFYVQQVHMI